MAITSIIGIITLSLSVLALLFTYYRYVRNKPRIDIVQLYKHSASAFSEYIDEVKFSYKDKVYQDISAFEFLFINSSLRSVEKEDTRPEDPLELYTKENTLIKDFIVIKEHGRSKADPVLIDEHTLRFQLVSMDKESALRVKILCTGENANIFARGKLIRADKSISQIKNLNSDSIYDSIDSFFKLFPKTAKVWFWVGLVFSLLIVIIWIIGLKKDPEARIFPPENYYTHEKQFYQIDSLIKDSSHQFSELLVHNIDSSITKIPLLAPWEDVRFAWSWYNDSIALAIFDSLKTKGYNVTYNWGRIEESFKEGFQLFPNQPSSGHKLVFKKVQNPIPYWDILEVIAYVLLGLAVYIILLVVIADRSKMAHFWNYRHLLSNAEVEKLKKENSNFFLTRILCKLLPPPAQ